MIDFKCRCGAALQIDESWAGRQVKCPNCGAGLRVKAKPRRRAPSSRRPVGILRLLSIGLVGGLTLACCCPIALNRPDPTPPEAASPAGSTPPTSATSDSAALERSTVARAVSTQLPPIAAEETAPALRNWHSNEGSHLAHASFAGLQDDRVLLHRATAAPVEVPLNQLSDVDHQYVCDLLRVDAQSSVIIGKIVGVTDGDTITVLDRRKTQHKIRLEGIDAPETGQAFGTVAKQALSSKVFGKFLWVEWREKDKYGRTLGHVYLDGRHINLEMVADGHAWHYKQYSNDARLANAELVARQLRLGLWRDSGPIPPWDFRRGANQQPVRGPPNTSATEARAMSPQEGDAVYVTQSGGKYHRSECRYLAKSKIPISLVDARKRYAPCSACNPPK